MEKDIYFSALLYALSVFWTGYYLVAVVMFLRGMRKKGLGNIVRENPAMLRELKNSILTAVLFTLIIFSTGILFERGYTRIYLAPDTYGYVYLVVSFVLLLLLHDTYFYWTHRLLHAAPLLKGVHRVHHLSEGTSPFAAFSFHPVEAVIQAGIIPLAVIVLPLNIYTFYTFIVYSIIANLAGHSGYELLPAWFKRSRLGKYINSPLHHNVHHEKVTVNYGSYFSIWDVALGTRDKATRRQA
jgi:lathosterol oxidase